MSFILIALFTGMSKNLCIYFGNNFEKAFMYSGFRIFGFLKILKPSDLNLHYPSLYGKSCVRLGKPLVLPSNIDKK